MDRSVLGAAAFNALESITGVGHVARAMSGSNFEKPIQNSITPSKSGPSQRADQSWKWKGSEGNSRNDTTFPGTQGNIIIVSNASTQGSMSSNNLNISNHVNHQNYHNSQTTMSPRGIGSSSTAELVISGSTKTDTGSPNSRPSHSSTIKQSNVVKGGK